MSLDLQRKSLLAMSSSCRCILIATSLFCVFHTTPLDVAGPKGVKRNPWYRRLRALVLRTLTCTCVPSHPNIQSPLST